MKRNFKEAYSVIFSYTNEKGFRVQSVEETVLVPVNFGAKEKCSHQKAEKLIKEKYKGQRCQIVSVSYQ